MKQLYTIQKRTFEALYELDPVKKAEFNRDTLTSEGCPESKYTLTFLGTEWGCKTLEECYARLADFGINPDGTLS